MVHYTYRVDASQLFGKNSYWKQVTKLYTNLGPKLGNTGFCDVKFSFQIILSRYNTFNV